MTAGGQPSGVAQALAHVLGLELGILGYDLLRRLAGGEMSEYERNRDANAANAGLAAAHAGIDRDSPERLHMTRVALRGGVRNAFGARPPCSSMRGVIRVSS